MLPTFVIGLREGLEAALIVGIVAAFLNRESRRDALKHMWLGVAIAVAICTAVGVGLYILGGELPQRQQEMLETVIGFVAVGMITFMIIWMVRHSAELREQLHGQAANALAEGSILALIGMAFFAVIREGFETAVFLVAAFNSSLNATTAGIGAALGLLASFVIGYGIYRGGVKINLSRFFRLTAAVLVLVAAGLVAKSMHTGAEAGWFTFGQGQALDLTWLVQPGTITAALLTGMLGLQPQPTQTELIAYLLYAIPMLTYVLWPRQMRSKKPVSARRSTPNARSSAQSSAQSATS
jgi:high-affinity iron transporter